MCTRKVSPERRVPAVSELGEALTSSGIRSGVVGVLLRTVSTMYSNLLPVILVWPVQELPPCERTA